MSCPGTKHLHHQVIPRPCWHKLIPGFLQESVPFLHAWCVSIGLHCISDISGIFLVEGFITLFSLTQGNSPLERLSKFLKRYQWIKSIARMSIYPKGETGKGHKLPSHPLKRVGTNSASEGLVSPPLPAFELIRKTEGRSISTGIRDARRMVHMQT